MKCTACAGSGIDPHQNDEPKPCPRCDGRVDDFDKHKSEIMRFELMEFMERHKN